MKKLLLCTMIISMVSVVKAQDTIVLNSGSSIIGYIIQARTDSVLYSLENAHGRVFSVAVNQVADLRFSNSRETYSGIEKSNVDTLGPFTNSIKIGFLAPAFGHMYFSYEKVLNNNMSLDIYLGGILDENYDYYYSDGSSYGGYLRLGLRFYFNNYMKQHGRKTYSPLIGQYFSVLMSHTFWQFRNYYYVYDVYWGTSTNYSSLTHAYSGSIHWLYGFQLPIAKHLSFNMCAGMGYSLSKFYGDSSYSGFEYSHAKPFGGAFSVTGMVQFGYAF